MKVITTRMSLLAVLLRRLENVLIKEDGVIQTRHHSEYLLRWLYPSQA